MSKRITPDQYQKLRDVLDQNNPNEIAETFEELTGLVVKPYTAYEFYDAAGNYLGDTGGYGIREILDEADIVIEEERMSGDAHT